MKRSIFSRTYPPWVWAVVSLCLAAAVALFFIPVKGVKFWAVDYLIFLTALLAIPAMLLTKQSRYSRAVIILFALAYFGFLQAACPRPPGSIELLMLHLTDKKPIAMYLIKLGVFVGMALIFGRYYCGWICPKGVIQEYVFQPRLKLKVPPKLDRILKYGKYVTLILLIAFPLIWDYRLFRHLGPFRVIFNVSGGVFLVSFLVVTLLSSIFIERAYCRYFCPEGGLLALLSLISPLRMRAEESLCISCNKCVKVCPTDAIRALPERGGIKISQSECITCKNCEEACTQNGLTYGPRSMKTNKENSNGLVSPGSAIE